LERIKHNKEVIALRTIIILLAALFYLNCQKVYIDEPPAAPTGLYSITGDNEVTLIWDANTEPDLEGYAVYKNGNPEGRYELIGITEDTYLTTYIPNGETWYFAVSAHDFAHNESEMSYETAWDTPRPEGHNLMVFAFMNDTLNTNINKCALDFSDFREGMVQHLDNASNDIYIDFYEGAIYLNAWSEDTDIYTFGHTEYLSDVDWVEEDLEWNEDGYVPLYEDYSYIVWTYDNHFVTIRVKEVYETYILLDWAYQLDPGNPELKIGLKNPTTRISERKIRLYTK